MTLKNIIFDLGGVLIDINYQRSTEAFSRLGGANFNEVFTQSKQEALFDEYETGRITSATFRERLQKRLGLQVSDDDFDQAWNAMLLDLPGERLDFVKSLKKSYRVFLFSNTNEIHLKEVFNICQRQNGFNHFGAFFDKEYYSHLFGKRKPQVEAFQTILVENDLKANETLFVDDSLQHILGAREAGLQAIHLMSDKSLFKVMEYLE